MLSHFTLYSLSVHTWLRYSSWSKGCMIASCTPTRTCTHPYPQPPTQHSHANPRTHPYPHPPIQHTPTHPHTYQPQASCHVTSSHSTHRPKSTAGAPHWWRFPATLVTTNSAFWETTTQRQEKCTIILKYTHEWHQFKMEGWSFWLYDTMICRILPQLFEVVLWAQRISTMQQHMLNTWHTQMRHNVTWPSLMLH